MPGQRVLRRGLGSGRLEVAAAEAEQPSPHMPGGSLGSLGGKYVCYFCKFAA